MSENFSDKISDSAKLKQTHEFYDFDGFRLDVKKRRLTRGDDIVSLTPKEYEVLLLLVENAGRVVEKDKLLDTVWKDTFVEDATLTRNISWLRKKLAAQSDAKIIETLPKLGYRFLPEIRKMAETAFVVEEQIVQHIQIEEIIEYEPSESAHEIHPFDFTDASKIQPFQHAAPEAQIAAPVSRDYKALPAAPVSLNAKKPTMIWALLAVTLLIVAAFAVFATYRAYFSAAPPNSALLAAKIAPFSGLPGRENSPAFSPDGKQMVFAWDGAAENGNFDVYIKLIGAGEPVRLTSGDADEINPVFSPDGKSIAFVRIFQTHNEIVLMSALGGGERVIYDQASYGSVSFSPDGNFLAIVELGESKENPGIYLINLQSREKIRLTAPVAPAVDHTPRFSPDGKSLAFIRYFAPFHREAFIVSAAGGEPRQMTFDAVRIYGLVWSSDSQDLFFTSFRVVNRLNLWQISANGGEPQLIETGSRGLQSLAISPNGRTLAFVEETIDENIWEITPGNPPRSFIRSTLSDHSPQFSPDGKQVAFASDRTGNYEIWLADAEGKNQRQLTDSTAQAGSPHFSPDGKFIVYDAQIAGGSDIFIVPISGGATRKLTETGKTNSLPAWSADGKWIFFRSNRTGSHQIWKMPVSGGDAIQITRQGAFESFVAPDGKTIIYTKASDKAGLWTIGIDGSEEKPIPELAEVGAWRSWTIAGNAICYTAFNAQPPFKIRCFDLETRQTKEIGTVEKSPLAHYSNLSVSADGNRILYARQDQSQSAIMFAELKE